MSVEAGGEAKWILRKFKAMSNTNNDETFNNGANTDATDTSHNHNHIHNDNSNEFETST